MSKGSRILTGLFAAAAMGILILDNQFAISTVAEGIQMCIQTVIPALFPFFVLSSLVVSSLDRLPGFFLRLLGVSPVGGSVLLTGLLGGYPVGVKTVSEAYMGGRLSQTEATRLLPLCNQCGPAFIFGMTMQLFQDVRLCLLLWGVQLASVLLTAWTIPTAATTEISQPTTATISLSDALQRGLRAMSTVCGWVILFRLLIQFLQRWLLWRCPLPCQITFSGLLELTNGCIALEGISDAYWRFLLCAVFLSFGGLCVTMQSISVLHPDIKSTCYFPGKVLQASYSILLVSILYLRISTATWVGGIIVFICVLFFRKSKNAVAFPKNLLYNGIIKDKRDLLCSLEKR